MTINRPNPDLRNLNLNSTLAFICAFLITTFIHELGHFVTWQMFDFKAVLHHNYVETFDQQVPDNIMIISALAGPLVSLFQGIVFSLLVIKRSDNHPTDLILLWISLLGFVNFFGYLMMTPLFISGDTGKVAAILQIPMLIRFLIAGAGLAILLILVIKTGRHFIRFIPCNAVGKIRNKYLNHVLLFPILTGSAVNVLLAFPVGAVLSIIYPATSAFVIMSCYGAVLKEHNLIPGPVPVSQKISRMLVLFAIGGIILNRLLT